MTGPELAGEGGLRYGDSTLPIPGELLTGAILIGPRIPSGTPEPRDIIERALDTPLDLPPLSRIVKAGEKVAIAVPDVTRYCGSEIYLPVIVEKLEEAGILRKDISFFVALGIHRKLTEDELDSVTGGLSGEISTFQHDPDSNLTYLGRTSMGTPVHVNADFLTYERIIATGTVSFHYFAGFGGGRKVIVPGLAGRETCHATHFRVFSEGTGKHPRAKSGVLAGNPVHEDVTEAAGMVTVDFCLNTCITPEKVLFQAFGGTILQSFEAACSHYADFFRMELPGRLPLVIASAGGYPKDINFIQSHKALDNAFQAVTEGGVIILVAECRDGFGDPGFYSWFRFEDLNTFEAHLRRDYFIYGQTAHSVLYKARKVKVILVSELDSGDVLGMSMEAAHDLDNAVAKARAHLGVIDRFYLIPDAGYVLPKCE